MHIRFKDGFFQASSLIESFISDGADDFLVTDTTASFYTRVGVIAMADTATVSLTIGSCVKTFSIPGCLQPEHDKSG